MKQHNTSMISSKTVISKKILFITYNLGIIGGAERRLTALVKGLYNQGFEPHILTLCEGGFFWDELKTWGKCPLLSLNRKGRMDFSIIFKIARYAKANQIDLIQGWSSPQNSYAAIVGMMINRPVVMGILDSKPHCRFFGSWGCTRIHGFFTHFATVKAIICNSYQGKKYYQGFFSPKKLCLIPNGIPIPTDITWPKPLAHEPPWHIAIIARLDPIKDHLTLFKAIASQGKAVILHIYGEGDDDYRRHLKQQAEALKIHARWHGVTHNVWEVLKNIDILVSSSLSEGLPNSLLEGMAAGRIIVATDVGDIQPLLTGHNTKCGYLVPPNNVEMLAQAIDIAIEQADLTLTQAAQQVVRKYYHVDVMVDAYAKLYQQVIDKSDSQKR